MLQTLLPRLPLLLAIGLLAASAPPALAAGPDTIGAYVPNPGLASPAPAVADTFFDPGARDLWSRGREARGELEEGLEAWNGHMWERIRVGLDGSRFRRARGLFQQERSARIGWRADGERIVIWEGLHRAVPIAGWSTDDILQSEEQSGSGLAADLLTDGLPPPLLYDPGSDRLLFAGTEGPGAWALDPLADTAGLHYQFRSGDTLRLSLPGAAGPITLTELRVQPRRSEFRLLTGSLWFEGETGSLVRAIYRPGAPLNLRVNANNGGPGGRVLPSFEAEIRVISVDYGLYDLTWWLPRRFVFDGEARVGGLLSVPVEFEWELVDIRANDLASDDLVPMDLPEGWLALDTIVSRGEGQEEQRHRIVVPAGEELLESSELERVRPPGGRAASRTELDRLETQVRRLATRPPGLNPQVVWGLEDGITRFNRVEGLATGVGGSLTLSRGRTLDGRVQVGFANPVPSASLTLSTGGSARARHFSAYSRLTASAHRDRPLGVPASISTFILGGGPSPFHRASGVSVERDERLGDGTSGRLRLFAEDHRAVEKGTDLHGRRAFDSNRGLAPVIPAREGQWAGLTSSLRWFSGVDPEDGIAFGSMDLQGAAGSSEWARGELLVGATLPVPGASAWAVAGEVGGGGSLGDLPFQNRFFPGGADHFRGLRIGERSAGHYGLARLEVGRGFPGARMVLFGDLLRVGGDGSREFHSATSGLLEGTEQPGHGAPRDVWAVGVGGSLLDGLVRTDVVRTSANGGAWRFLFYLDGLF